MAVKLTKTLTEYEKYLKTTNDGFERFQYVFEFPNGYGASVVSFRGDEYWELGVLANGEFCDTTPITDDVIPGLDDEEVSNILNDIMKLPQIKE